MKQELITISNEKACAPIHPQEQILSEDALGIEREDPLVVSVRNRIKRYNRTLFAAILYCGVGTFTFALIAHAMLQSPLSGIALRYLFPLAALVFGTIIVGVLHPRKLLIAGKKDIEQVASQDDLKVVGTLVEMINLEKEISVSHARESLTTLLPQLRPEHAHLLNRRQRDTLRRVLGINIELMLYRDVKHLFAPVSLEHPDNRRAIEFRIAIIEALSNIGTKEDVGTIETLAAMETTSEIQSVLKNAAEKCLPLLQRRVVELEDKNTLLRASSVHLGSTDTLLRPAMPAPSEPHELLLRPELGE